MPKRAKALTDKQVKALANKPKLGLHSVGGTGAEGLALQVKSENAASWVIRVKIGDKRRDIGLGSYPVVSLAEARERAIHTRRQISNGIDPVQEKKAHRSALKAAELASVTFKDVAIEYVRKKESEYTGKAVAQRIQKLESQLEVYVYPIIGTLLPGDIKLPQVEKILSPIWNTKVETANRIRLHIEKIMDLAKVRHLYTGENPARWKGHLDQILTKPSKVADVTHRAALPVSELPGFMHQLRQQSGTSAKVLEFQILTACRPGEARAAKWDQIDLIGKKWTIPAGDMKERKEHVVPLCEHLVTLLESLPRENDLIFPNTKGGQLTDVAVSKVAKKIYPGITCHGFRSTFKDWARTHGKHYSDEVSELQLAHVSTDATRVAYARDKLLGERRQMMQDYELYCEKEVSFL